MCQGCVNPVVAFSWLGGLLINFSFVALISWGTATFWPVGLGLAILYTALLFTAASCLRQRESVVPRFVVDIFLLLGVAGIGACGTILAYNVLGCDTPRSVDGSAGDSSISWRFPPAAANGSVDVLIWAVLRSWEPSSPATFVYEPSTSTLFFRGCNGTMGSELVWRSPAGGLSPAILDAELQNPRYFVTASQRACFVAYSDISAIHCSTADGSTTRLTVAGNNADLNPQSLLTTSDGNLYFKASAPFGSTPQSGVVYRAEPPFLTATLLSVPDSVGLPPPPPPASPGSAPSSPPSEGCNTDEGFRSMAIGMLFLATLPALLTSIVLWWRLKTPSMSFATFCGISGLAINIYAIIQPGGEDASDFFRWWFFSFGATYLLIFITLRLQNRVDLNTFRWAIDAGCISYVAAMHAIVEVPFTDEAWRWVVYQFTFLLPMLLIATVSASTTTGLPLVLASAAVFIDAYKLATELTNLVSDTNFQTFIIFAILGLVGLGVVGAGLAYNQNQQRIVDTVDEFAERACGSCRLRKKTDPEKTDPEKPNAGLTAGGASCSSAGTAPGGGAISSRV